MLFVISSSDTIFDLCKFKHLKVNNKSKNYPLFCQFCLTQFFSKQVILLKLLFILTLFSNVVKVTKKDYVFQKMSKEDYLLLLKAVNPLSWKTQFADLWKLAYCLLTCQIQTSYNAAYMTSFPFFGVSNFLKGPTLNIDNFCSSENIHIKLLTIC